MVDQLNEPRHLETWRLVGSVSETAAAAWRSNQQDCRVTCGGRCRPTAAPTVVETDADSLNPNVTFPPATEQEKQSMMGVKLGFHVGVSRTRISQVIRDWAVVHTLACCHVFVSDWVQSSSRIKVCRFIFCSFLSDGHFVSSCCENPAESSLKDFAAPTSKTCSLV